MADAAWVDVLPSLRGFVPELRKQLGDTMPKAGKDAGEQFGRGLVSGVQQASSQLAAARRKEADAAGVLRVAEAKLADLRASGRAKAAQLVAAEEQLARAKRTLDERTDAVARSTRGLSDAQERAGREAKTLDRNLDGVRQRTGLLHSSLGRLTGIIAGIGLGRLFAGFVKDAQESARISRLTEAAIRSTGGAANVTAGQVNNLATAISNKTAVDDETVQSASNVLLAFTRVRNETGRGNDVFNQATQAAIDMSAAMGVDANAAAKQLGRALNDPIGSLGALSRAGVQFTQQQRDQIKAMVEAGDTLGAQRLILDQVQQRFGGAARAAADPLEQLKVIAANLGEQVGGVLLPIIGRFATWVGDTLIPAIQSLWSWLSARLGPAFRSVIDFVRSTVIPAVRSLGEWFARNTDWLVPLVAALGAALLAFRAFMFIRSVIAAVAAFNAVLLANPIGLVIAGLAALGAALVIAWNKSETFRAVVTKVWQVVQAAAQFMWANVLQPIFKALQATWTAVATAISWAWNNLIKPTWDAIRTAISFLWTSVLRPTFTAVSTAWNAVGTAIGWVWNNLIRPIWDGVSAAIRGLWNNVLRPVFSAISAAWDAVGRAIGTVYRNFIKPILDGFGAAVQWVKSTFQTAVDGIARIWNTIKAILRAPVQWVIDVVWNNGLRKLWNWINNLWGGDDLAEFRFAEGGTIPSRLGAGGRSLRLADGGTVPGYTPGRDVHRFFSPTAGLLELSGGEAVLRPEITRALGTATIDQWNAAARAGGVTGFRRAIAQGSMRTEGRPPQSFAKGGTISLPGWLDTSLNFLGAPIATAVRAVLNPINNSGGEGNGLWGDMIWGLVKNTASKLWEKAKSLFDSGAALAPGSGGGGRFAVQPNGWPARILGVVSPNVARAISAVRALFPAITSVGTIGSRSYASDHPWGKAADFMLPGWNLPSGRALGYQVADYLSQLSTQVGLKYLIFNNQFSSGSGWGPYYYPGGGVGNATTMHLDHVHASFYDQGGPVPPGMSVVYNGTRGAEVARILTPEQDWTFRRAMAGGEGTAAAPSEVTGAKFYGPVILQDLDTLMREQNRAARRAMAAAGFR